MIADDATARGDLAEALIPDAAFLAMAVRDRDPADVHQRLAGLTRHELEALTVVLAGLVDPDRSIQDALGWITFDEHGHALDTPHTSDQRPIRQVARDPDTKIPGADYAAALRGLEGERLPLRGVDRTLAVQIGMRRDMTREAVARELCTNSADYAKTLAAVKRTWERITARKRAEAAAEQDSEAAA